MKTNKMILPMICCIPLLSSCATTQPAGKQSWNIQPVYKVNNRAVDSPDAMYQLGRYYQGQRRYDQAAEAYHHALEADGGFVEAHNGLGVIYSMQRRYDEAITEFRTAISQAPTAAHLYNNLGHALYLKGDYPEAVAALTQAASLDPKNPRTLNNLALAYAKAGEAEKSRQVFAMAANQASSDAALAASTPHEQAVASQPAPIESDSGAKPASSPSVVVTPVSPDQSVDPQPAPVESRPDIQQAVATQAPSVQTLALPKDRGVISSAAVVPVAPTESRVETAQTSPKVNEASERAEPVQAAAIVATTESVPEAAVAQAESIRRHLEISNGNGVTGMAKKIAYFLQESGYAKARLTNRKPFTVQTTQIQYRYGHQEDAEHLRSSLPGNTGIAPSNNLRADINLRVVLGRDMLQHTAYFNGNSQKMRFVSNDLN
jgi:tetratricopeptide (TPR) repeat protein